MKIILTIMLVMTLYGCGTYHTTIDTSNYVEGNRQAIPTTFGEPSYPISALRKGISGHVEFLFDLTPKGKPINIRITESEPNGVFDVDATRSLRGYVFEPAIVNGNPVGVTNMYYKMSFKVAN